MSNAARVWEDSHPLNKFVVAPSHPRTILRSMTTAVSHPPQDHGPQGRTTAHVTQEEGWYHHEGKEGKRVPQGLVRALDLG